MDFLFIRSRLCDTETNLEVKNYTNEIEYEDRIQF